MSLNPQDVESALAVYRLLLGLNLLATLVNSILAGLAFFRRPVPLDKELADFVRRSTCEGTHRDAEARRRAIYEYVNERFSAGEKLFREIERALGRIEGQVNKIASGQGHVPS